MLGQEWLQITQICTTLNCNQKPYTMTEVTTEACTSTFCDVMTGTKLSIISEHSPNRK